MDGPRIPVVEEFQGEGAFLEGESLEVVPAVRPVLDDDAAEQGV